MSASGRFERVRELFDEVVELEPEERAARLSDACRDDRELRDEVELLLEAAEAKGWAAGQALEAIRPEREESGDHASTPGVIPPALQAALEGRYAIAEEIGRGGMATVYLAEDLKHGRKVAIKVLKAELAAALGAERFLNEIKTTANLQHPHVLPLFDSGEADGYLYYVMPYVAGDSLRGRLDREHQLPVDEAVHIAMRLAEALDYAHRQGVVHRDIKPANVLTLDGEPVLSDFGIALAIGVAGGGRLTEKGMSLGTPHYMSPEQASGEPDVSARSDVYSLACVLYETLTGRPPHTGRTAQAVLAGILTDEPPPVAELRPSVPPNVASAVSRALERLPADRFRSAADFADALGDPDFRHEGSRQKSSITDGMASRGREPGRARWLAAWESRVVLAALAVVTFLLLWNTLADRLGVPAESPPGPTTMFEVPLGPLELEVPSQMALSPDGRTLVFVSQRPGGVPSLYRRGSDEVEITRIPGTENASTPAFSPDGGWVVFVQNGVTLKRVPVAGGRPENVPFEGSASGHVLSAGSILADPSWGPDGSILFAAQRGLYRVPADGGTAEQILATAGFTSRMPRYVDGTDGVLYTHVTNVASDPEVRLLHLESRETTPVVPGSDGRYLPPDHLIYGSVDGSMVAAPFDPGEGVLIGGAIELIPHVGMGPTGYRGTHFALAESGAAVYAVGSLTDYEHVLVTIGLDGRGEERIPGLPVGTYSAPRFDPSGRQIAFERDDSLWIRDLTLGSQRLLQGGPVPAYNPIWSRDGSRIAFGSRLPSDTLTQLRVRPSDLSSEAETVLYSPAFLPPSAWSGGDSLIVYTEVEGGEAAGAEIWYVSSTPAADPRPFLRADGWDEGFASLSPDGRWAAYESNMSGRNAVYVQSFPVPGERKQVSEGGGVGARWTADGERIFYRSGDTVKVARVRTDPDFAVVSHEILFTGPYIGIEPNPDGTGFVAIKPLRTPESAQDRRLFWVVNWLDGVRAQLEGG